MYKPYKLLIMIAALMASQNSVLAQGSSAYPSRPITMIVPMSPGGTSDLLARNLVPLLTEKLGQTIVVENRVGANGAIGEEIFSRAKPDGYTIMLEAASIATNPWMNNLICKKTEPLLPSYKIEQILGFFSKLTKMSL